MDGEIVRRGWEMTAAVNNKDEGNHPSSALPEHLVQVVGEAGMEHTLPVRFPRDVREGKWQNNELKKLQTRSLVAFISV